jgi:hypothetical protein
MGPVSWRAAIALVLRGPRHKRLRMGSSFIRHLEKEFHPWMS